MAHSALELLKHTTVKELMHDEHQDVLTLYTGTSVRDALVALSARGCTAAPVKDADKREYVGMLSVLDIVAFAVEAMGGWYTLRRHDFRVFADIVGHAFFETDIGEIAGRTHHGPFPYIPMQYTNVHLERVFELVFAKGIHRVPIADETDTIVHVLTQSACVRWAHKHMAELARGDTPLEELGLVSGFVISVGPRTRAIEALKCILDNRVQGVAIVDGSGALVGTFSASDLKHMTEDVFRQLVRPLDEFISILHALRHHRSGEAVVHLPPAITVRPGTTLAEAVRLLVDNRIHRVFIVDAAKKPLGVVTLTNVIEALLV